MSHAAEHSSGRGGNPKLGMTPPPPWPEPMPTVVHVFVRRGMCQRGLPPTRAASDLGVCRPEGRWMGKKKYSSVRSGRHVVFE